jgi:hypothetical protein
MLEADRQALKARDARIHDLESQVEDYRHQLSRLVARAIDRNRAVTEEPLDLPAGGTRVLGLVAAL